MQDLLIRAEAFDSVLFDLDNTLVEFIPAKRKACAAVIESIGCGDPDELFSYFLRRKYGFEDCANIFDYLSDNGVAGSATYLNACTTYEAVKLASIEPYPGIRDVVSSLSSGGVKLAVVTDADSDHAWERLGKAGLDGFFEAVITPDISGSRKPDPDSFLMALDSLRTKPIHALTIGDSIRRDIAPAQKLGMCTIHAAYGDWHPDETKEGALWTLSAEKPDHLHRLLLGEKSR